MKKTLMAICFAFCATAAFAQTNTVSLQRENNLNKVSRNGVVTDVNQATYKGSIFAKTGEIYVNTFATEPTTGELAAGAQINGTAVAAGHSQTAYHSKWHRIADTTAATNTAMSNAGNYPVTFDGTSYGLNLMHNLHSETPNDGFMLMTMQDQISAWGGTGTTGTFNAYMAFPAFATTGVAGFQVQIYQYYKKFNGDQCWIDYSTDNTTWSAMEINVKNVDVSVNSSIRGFVTKAMPASLANQANVYIRIRWEASTNGGGAYGYFWFVDDVKVSALPDERISVSTDQYYEGFYQLMPQGLQVPVVWTSSFTNSGLNTQNNVKAGIYTYTGNNAATEIANVQVGTLASGQSATATIDPLGFISADNWDGYCVEEPNPTSGTMGFIPTSATGTVHVYADITTATMSHIQLNDTTATFDTVSVFVNNDDKNIRTWGRDNGVLIKYAYFTAGMIEEGVWSSDPDDVDWASEEYAVMNSYVTGNNVPNGWVIKGVEIVGSTYPGFCEAGAKLGAMLYRDSISPNGLSVKGISTGASTHVVSANELNLAGVNNTDPSQSLEYELFGDYNTVVINFPDQPALESNTAYRIGYIMAEDGFFCAADNRNYYYDAIDTTSVAFRKTPGMSDYAHTFGVENKASVMVYDPFDQTFHAFNISTYPMIRMLVGPYEEYAKFPVSFECGENGVIYDGEYHSLCGATDSCVEGSTHTYIITPDEDYSVATITVNGEVVFDLAEYEDDPSYHGVELNYPIENIAEATTMSATFVYDPTAIAQVSNVAMTLQPNPATSNVQLTISGVEGMVNFSLIDMSGRVITSNMINAANVQNINVSNLAKGAYFVRITNNNMSKVEKLIVR